MTVSRARVPVSALRRWISRPGVWGLAMWLGVSTAPAALAQSAGDFGGYPGYGGPRHQGCTTEALYVSAQDGPRLAIDVHLQIGTSQRALPISGRPTRALQHGPDAGDELSEAERLGHIVIGTA